MNTKKSLAVVAVALTLVILACGNGGPANLTPAPAQQLMPKITGYNSTKGQDIEKTIANVAGGAATITLHPEMVTAIRVADNISQCYQDKGAVNVQVYNNEKDPLVAGAIVILDKKLLTDPKVMLQCATGFGLKASEVQPCTYSYSFQNKDSDFYIAYVGTTNQICADFCSNLEGCAKSQ